MSTESNGLSNQEKLKAENDFLKMKLMLENGAEFSFTNMDSGIPPEIENAFLRNIEAFERESANLKYTTVFERIQQPGFFRPAAEIPETEMDYAWDELSGYLDQFAIRLDVCSPNISNRELYRFTTEELFKQEIEDMNIPGMQTVFIYDEFHPDPVYDNSRMVQEELLHDIFSKRELFFEIHYARNGFVFNDQRYEDWPEYFQKIDRFKSLFDDIQLTGSKIETCIVNENECQVKGRYGAVAVQEKTEVIYEGDVEVQLVLNEFGYWDFLNIRIGGFDIG